MRWPWLPRLSPLGFLALSLLLVGALWVVPYLPTNDGPEWVFASHIENHYADPDAHYPLEYVPALQFAARGFTLLYDPFEAWLGWQRGLQVALTLVVLLAAWGFVALVRAIDPRRWALGFLGFPLALSWELYMGFWAFMVGSGLGLLLLALAVRLRAPTWRGRALLAFLLFVQAVAHVFTAVLTGAALLALLLTRAERGRRFGELARVALMGLPAIGVLVASVLVSHRATNVAFMEGFGRLPWSDVFAILPQTVTPGSFGRAVFVLAGMGAAAGVVLLRARSPETSAVDRGLGALGLLFLAAGVLAPMDVPGWQFFSPRFFPLGATLVVAVLPLERLSPAASRAAPTALFAIAGSWLALSYPFHRRLAALCPDAAAGLSAPVSRSLVQLPIALAIAEDPAFDDRRAEVPMALPLLHMGALYAAAHGGLIPFVFSSSPATYPFTNREHTVLEQPTPDLASYWSALVSGRLARDRAFRNDLENELTIFGTRYEGIVLFGADAEDLALWRDRGYVTDWTHGSTLLAHFEGCSVDFTVPAAAADPAPLFDVDVGTTSFLRTRRESARASRATASPTLPSRAARAVASRCVPAGARGRRETRNRTARPAYPPATTPIARPIANVTPAAVSPSTSCRAPDARTGRPVKSVIAAPIPKSPTAPASPRLAERHRERPPGPSSWSRARRSRRAPRRHPRLPHAHPRSVASSAHRARTLVRRFERTRECILSSSVMFVPRVSQATPPPSRGALPRTPRASPPPRRACGTRRSPSGAPLRPRARGTGRPRRPPLARFSR